MTKTNWTGGCAPALVTLALFGLTACAPTSSSDDDNLGEAREAALIDNALIDNALIDNALIDNALIDNALIDNALIDNALIDNALIDNALTDPKARELYKYVVSCALPADEHVTMRIEGVDYRFDGALGLAPEWGEQGGSCDEDCQSWVSACVISRLDYLGQPVLISLRGKNDALKSTAAERAAYSHIEATYYGDIFTEPKDIFACLPPGKTQIPRVCGPSLNGCVVQVQGNCEDLCGEQRNDGGYPNCRTAPTPKKNGGAKKGEKHVGSVTVFLQ